MMRVSAVLALVLVGAAGPAPGGDRMTVIALQAMCAAADEASQRACQFYILGVAEGVAMQAEADSDSPRICLPAKLDATAMERVVAKAISDELRIAPAERDRPAIEIVGAAIEQAFPCRGTG
jgi:hypothetical protein